MMAAGETARASMLIPWNPTVRTRWTRILPYDPSRRPTPSACGGKGRDRVHMDRRPHRSPINSTNRTHGIGRISGTPPSDGEMMTLFWPVAAALSACRPSYAR